MLKQVIERLPGGTHALSLFRKLRFRSADYWERRYQSGDNSGDGSYGELAQFKAEVVNRLLVERKIQSAVEFGCGDGNQLSLMRYPAYTGLDVSAAAVDICRRRFATDQTKRFAVFDPATYSPQVYRADLGLSLDVIYHLVEDAVFHSYMSALFDTAAKTVVIYSDDSNDNPAAAGGAVHVRHRKFSGWISANRPAWRLEEHIPNRYPYDASTNSGSWADFWVYGLS